MPTKTTISEVMHSAHAKYPISGLDTLAQCPGSINKSEEVKKHLISIGVDPVAFSESGYAKEGTEAHSWLQEVQVFETPPESIPDESMREAIGYYCSVIDDLMTPDMEVLTEQRVHFSKDVWGTADTIMWDQKTRHLIIIDFKYGLGDYVYAEKNRQLGGYARSYMREFRKNTLALKTTLIICQPRKYHLDVWEADRMWLERLSMEMTMIQVGNREPTVNPGSRQCQYCLASGRCEEQTKRITELLNEDTGMLSNEDLGVCHDNVKLVKNWVESLKKHMDTEWDAGNTIPGWKKVEGKNRRSWLDEHDARHTLENCFSGEPERATEVRVISPSKAEIALGRTRYKTEIESLVVTDKTAPAWVKSDNPKPAIARLSDDIDNL